MSYAVVQLGLDVPSVEQVKRAFGRVEGLAEMDALALGKEPFGMLARSFELPLAVALKNALLEEGVPADVVEEASLQLPDPYQASRLDFSPEALLISDSIGRVLEVPWRDVFLIVAGKVSMRKFVEVRRPWDNHIGEGSYKLLKSIDTRLAFTDRHLVGGKHTHWKLRPVDISTREETHDQHLLEIFLAGGKARYTVNAEKSLLVFSCLGERRTNNLSQDFLLLVRELVQHTPHATLNRGAFAAQENALVPFAYPTKIAFQNEIVWLLWQASREKV